MENELNSTHKIYSEACVRNREGIYWVLKQYFRKRSEILEIASGTGQHAEYFTKHEKEWFWQTSDQDESYMRSIREYAVESRRPNFLVPIEISTLDAKWDIKKYDGIYCSNMIHIATWESCVGLFQLSKNHLNAKSSLILYGPFFMKNRAPSVGNLEFDKSLKSRNPEFGIKWVHEVENLAHDYGFECIRLYEMAANNLCLVFQLIA